MFFQPMKRIQFRPREESLSSKKIKASVRNTIVIQRVEEDVIPEWKSIPLEIVQFIILPIKSAEAFIMLKEKFILSKSPMCYETRKLYNLASFLASGPSPDHYSTFNTLDWLDHNDKNNWGVVGEFKIPTMGALSEMSVTYEGYLFTISEGYLFTVGGRMKYSMGKEGGTLSTIRGDVVFNTRTCLTTPFIQPLPSELLTMWNSVHDFIGLELRF